MSRGVVMRKRKKREYKLLIDALRASGMSDQRIKALDTIIKNVAIMGDKLNETSEELYEADLTVEYNNGGGQSGIRENPLFRAYESLWKSYLSGMDTILDQFGTENAVETKPINKTVLELVRSKRRAEA
jgi:hypothetical protein